MTAYIYGTRLRGASIGAIPAKGVLEIINDRKVCDDYGQRRGRYYHSIVTYCRRLTAKEMDEFEMDCLGAE